MTIFRLVPLVLVIIGISCQGATFDKVFENSSDCSDTCLKTYTGHTNDTPNLVDVCQRGCRLYSIMRFVNMRESVNGTTSLCCDSCRESFKKSTDRDSCCAGCRIQAPFSVKLEQKLMLSPATLHVRPLSGSGGADVFGELASSMQYMRDLYSHVITALCSNVGYGSWSVYERRADGNWMLIRSGSTSLNSARAASGLHGTPTSTSLRTQIASTSDRTGKSTVTRDYNGRDWLECAAHKLNVPRWLLAALLASLSVALVYLCCSVIFGSDSDGDGDPERDEAPLIPKKMLYEHKLDLVYDFPPPQYTEKDAEQFCDQKKQEPHEQPAEVHSKV